MTRLLAMVLALAATLAPASEPESWVSLGDDGRLAYGTTHRGDRLPDFSHAGYKGGGVALPDAPVILEVDPGTAPDDTARLHAAIDKAGTAPLDPATGLRGAVLPKKGEYRVLGTLRITKDGVVLRGGNFDAALGMMKGVPDSPLTRYLQLEDCAVAFNTFVDCEQPFAIGIESSDGDTTLPPRDLVVANNLVAGAPGTVINAVNAPINFTWEGNIFQGASLGLWPVPAGIAMGAPGPAPAGSLHRPVAGSPAIDGAAGDCPSVTTDMDGDARPATGKDAGADEPGDPGPVCRPLTPDEVGPRWARGALPLRPTPGSRAESSMI